MTTWILAIGWGALTCGAAGAIAFIITSVYERRGRAAWIAVALSVPLLGLFAALLLLDFPARAWIVLGACTLGVVGVLLLVLPIGTNPPLRIPGPQRRIDERDAIFHRFYRLQPGTPEYAEYYRTHPEKQESDALVRALPRLAHPGSHSYSPALAPFQMATFEVLEHMTREIEWAAEPVEGAPVAISPEEATRRIKGFARHLGADLVGATELNPAYVYSHIGRSPGAWGAPIVLPHSHALAIVVEMGHEMIRHAPDSVTTTETAFQYFEAAKIALLVARYINRLGYAARAHVDGNYRVLCGPIAVDAGLGELGRLGLLITPQFGPRVRLSVVTTSLPLVPDRPVHFGVQHFCEMCRKCAACCPSSSIDFGEKAVYNGVEKWRSDQESCYRFWRVQGSDCAVCIRVCPYSHPATPLHDLVRRAVRRNAWARRIALWADDLFYGRQPKACGALPDWHARQ